MATPVRLDSLTGSRFLAALVVFASHAAIVGDFPRVDFLTDQGFVGVSFFFILSGFVLTWSHREDDTPRAFFRRRLARIGPSYLVCLVLGAVVVAYLSGDVVGTVVTSAPSLLGLQAWVPSDAAYYGGNAVGWSISCELLFYALFPALVVATRSRGRSTTLAALGASVVVLTPLLLRPSFDVHDLGFWAVYIFPLQRLGEFVLGMVLATAMLRGWRSPLRLPAAMALAAGAYVVAGVVPFWAAVAVVTVIPFTLLIGAAASADLSQDASVLRRRTLVRLGEWSFAFYLVHHQVLLVAERIMARLDVPESSAPLAVALAFGVSLGAASWIHRRVERPMERRLRVARPRTSAAGVPTHL